MGPNAVCMPDKKKLSQLKAIRLRCEGTAASPMESGSTTLLA